MDEQPEPSPLRRLLNGARFERERTQSNKQREEAGFERGAKPWGIYNENAAAYLREFGRYLRDADELPDRLKERKARGERVLVVDICGEADATSIGADLTVCLTLTGDPRLASEQKIVVPGDVFSKKDRQHFLERLDREVTPISCVFFRPIGGFTAEHLSDFTAAKLYMLFQEIYARLADGGEMYIRLGVSQRNLQEVTDRINAAAGIPIAEYAKDSGTEYMHLRKVAGAPARI